jgi:hypothetical protein
LINFSTQKHLFLNIFKATLRMRTEYPCLFKYSAIVINPMGYISKIGVEGTTSLIGPYIAVLFLKSYTLGG